MSKKNAVWKKVDWEFLNQMAKQMAEGKIQHIRGPVIFVDDHGNKIEPITKKEGK